MDGTDEKLSGFSFVPKQFIIRTVEQKGKSVFLWGWIYTLWIKLWQPLSLCYRDSNSVQYSASRKRERVKVEKHWQTNHRNGDFLLWFLSRVLMKFPLCRLSSWWVIARICCWMTKLRILNISSGFGGESSFRSEILTKENKLAEVEQMVEEKCSPTEPSRTVL